MENLKYYAFISLVLGIIAVILYLSYEITSFNRTGANKFSFLRNYPYEANCFRKNQKSSWILVTTKILIVLLFIIPFVFYVIYKGSADLAFNIILLVLALASLVTFFFLSFTKLSNLKLHLGLMVTFTMLVFLINIVELMFLGAKDKMNINHNPQVAIVVVTIALFLFQCFLLLNPSYKTWDKMQKVGSDNYIRPKFCYLCILEWGSGLVFVLEYASLFIAFFFGI
jgi:hypothetical protein